MRESPPPHRKLILDMRMALDCGNTGLESGVCQVRIGVITVNQPFIRKGRLRKSLSDVPAFQFQIIAAYIGWQISSMARSHLTTCPNI
jgi:hypothetical protein